MTAMICIALAFLLAIWGNWKYKINMGVASAVAAFVIGCFMLGLSPKALKNMLPLNVIFPLTSISMFFGFSLENGALIKLVKRILKKTGNNVSWYPVLLFFISAALGIAGLDAGSIILIIAPIAMRLADMIGLDPIAVSASFLMGGPMGSNYMMSSSGSVIRGLLEDAGNADPMRLASTCFWDGAAVFTILFFAIYLIRLPKMKQRVKETAAQLEADEPLTKQQKTTLWLILIAFLFGTLPRILLILLPNSVFKQIAGYTDMGFICLVGVLVSEILRLGELKTIIKKHVPCGLLVMISGVAMLMGVAKESGLVELLANAVAGHESVWMIPGFVVLIAGCMSCFSGAISVVIPTLFAVVPVVAEGSGLDLGLLYSCSVLGASLTGMSPFSTGGALAVGNVPDETVRSKMIYQQMLIAVVSLLTGAVYMTLRNVF